MILLSFSRQEFAWYAYIKRFDYARQSSSLYYSCSLDLAVNIVFSLQKFVLEFIILNRLIKTLQTSERI